MAVAYHSNMAKFGPNAQLVAVTHHWGDYYTRRAQAALKRDLEGRAGVGRHPRRHDQTRGPVGQAAQGRGRRGEGARGGTAQGRFHPFTGPVRTNDGKVVVESGALTTSSCRRWTTTSRAWSGRFRSEASNQARGGGTRWRSPLSRPIRRAPTRCGCCASGDRGTPAVSELHRARRPVAYERADTTAWRLPARVRRRQGRCVGCAAAAGQRRGGGSQDVRHPVCAACRPCSADASALEAAGRRHELYRRCGWKPGFRQLSPPSPCTCAADIAASIRSAVRRDPTSVCFEKAVAGRGRRHSE